MHMCDFLPWDTFDMISCVRRLGADSFIAGSGLMGPKIDEAAVSLGPNMHTALLPSSGFTAPQLSQLCILRP